MEPRPLMPYDLFDNKFAGIWSLTVPVLSLLKMSVTFGKVGTPRAIRKGSEYHMLRAWRSIGGVPYRCCDDSQYLIHPGSLFFW